MNQGSNKYKQKLRFAMPDSPRKKTNLFSGSSFDKLNPKDESMDDEESCASNNYQAYTNEALRNRKRMSIWDHFCTEINRDYLLEHDKDKFTERRKRVYTFILIPIELEKFITYGFFQCLDAFLFLFTFLPLRVLRTFSKFILYFLFCIKRFQSDAARQWVLGPAEICDILKVIILSSSFYMMSYVDVSMMYHIIRGQTVIKLYLFFNMLDICDKLCSSIGQDVLDSLFWTATERSGWKSGIIRIIFHLLLAIAYVFFHTILVLFQANTLNVAFNSHNKSLLTIMMSNNFVELKASVFKKFEKGNLFQMSCSDVRERFHLLVLLLIVAVRNLTEFAWNMEHFWVLIPDMILVMVAELVVDWVKHAFITKFNELTSDVYREYSVSIAYDIAGSRHAHAFSDHLDVVSRRMGFIPLPLAVLLIRIFTNCFALKTIEHILILIFVYIALVMYKLFSSILLLNRAYDLIDEDNKISKQSKQWHMSHFEARVSSSKDDLELLKVKPHVSKWNGISVSTQYRRYNSLVEMPSIIDDLYCSSDEQADENLDPLKRANHSCSIVNINNLFSNSTVSLDSVSLNEEYVLAQSQLINDDMSTANNSPSNSYRHRCTTMNHELEYNSSTPKKKKVPTATLR